jgi:pilus assembly protein FimV
MDEEDEDAPVLTSGEHPAVGKPTGEYDMSRIQDLIQGGSGETAIIPEIPDQDLDSTAEGVDITVSDVDFGAEEPEFEDDPGPNYNMGGTAELPVMDDVDDFELDLEVEAGATDDEESEPSVVSQLVTSVSEDMMDGDEDEPQLVSEIMPAISDDMLDRTIVQDSASFAGDATVDILDDGDEVETMLDLAKAYLDMGDADSASSALEEIIAAGNDRQRQEAQELLHKIS